MFTPALFILYKIIKQLAIHRINFKLSFVFTYFKRYYVSIMYAVIPLDIYIAMQYRL